VAIENLDISIYAKQVYRFDDGIDDQQKENIDGKLSSHGAKLLIEDLRAMV
jgi:hypothetical protein